MSEFQPYQLVQIVKERGTRQNAVVLGVTRSGKIVVKNLFDGEQEIVDREDVETA